MSSHLLKQNTNWAAYVPNVHRTCMAVHATEHPKFKSRICRHWLKGFCRLGEACAFAHGWGDKRQYMNQAGRPEHVFLELGNEEIEIITDWHELANE